MSNSSTTARTIHGIDPYAPGGLDALFAHHRAISGDLVMEAPTGGEGGDGTPPASTEDQGAGKEGAETPPWGKDEDFDPAKAWQLIQNLRSDKSKADTKVTTAAQEAATKAQDELVQKLGKELGLIKDDKPVDAAQLTQALSEKDQAIAERDGTIRSLLVDSALNAALVTEKAKPLTLAVLKGEGKLADLDPSSDDFSSKVSELVKNTLKANPELKLNAAAPSSGPDFSGASGNRKSAPKSMTDAVSQRLFPN